MRIQIPNPFDFSARKSFLPQINNITDNVLILDFDGVETIDSAALGMLLMSRERAKKFKSKVSLINCNTKIKKILEVAQFHILFKIT
ncbi:MAG: STAS domain-containing protein [Magnetococcales bacterium]|nr:STAS domain-containing protein [Magnetococcales bacterium]